MGNNHFFGWRRVRQLVQYLYPTVVRIRLVFSTVQVKLSQKSANDLFFFKWSVLICEEKSLERSLQIRCGEQRNIRIRVVRWYNEYKYCWYSPEWHRPQEIWERSGNEDLQKSEENRSRIYSAGSVGTAISKYSYPDAFGFNTWKRIVAVVYLHLEMVSSVECSLKQPHGKANRCPSHCHPLWSPRP